MRRNVLVLGSVAIVIAPFLRHPGDGVVLGAALVVVALAYLLVA